MDKYGLLTLNQIFDGGERAFRIPDYQRGYSWEEPQWTDLLKDIEYVMSGGYRHYTGTIVATESNIRPQNNGLALFEVVDGQQRLTTLILLISAIIHQLRAPNVSSELKSIAEQLEKVFIAEGIKTGNKLRKLKLGKDQDPVFWNLIHYGEIKAEEVSTKSVRNLKEAYDHMAGWLTENSMDLESVIDVLINKLGFLFYAPENDAEIGIMFEVINNRGKELSELEKVKNYLMYYADKNAIFDLKEDVNRAWVNILTRLNTCSLTSNDDENNFLRNCWIVSQDTNKSKSYYVYNQLKEKYPPSDPEAWKEIKQFVDFIDQASKTYEQLYTRNHVEDRTEKLWLKRIHYHPSTASIIPLILAIYARCSDTSMRILLLEIIEKLNFRFYGTGIANRSDTGQGELFQFAHQYFNHYGKKIDGELIDDDWLKKSLIDYANGHAKDEEFVKYLTLDKNESGDYYTWQGLRFFLASYEEELRREIKESDKFVEWLMSERDPQHVNDYYQREHIWATKETDIVKDEKEKDINKRRLGNFVLLKTTANIRVSDHRVEKKVKEYVDDYKNNPNTLMIRELAEFYKAAVSEIKEKRQYKTNQYWYEVYQRMFDLREQKMINFALKRWRIDGLQKKVLAVEINSNTDQNEIYKLDKENK